jgi:hypothetical protein
LDVTMGAAGDGADLSAPVGPITVSDQNGPVACTGGPTTSNTDAISVHNTPGGANNVVRIAEASRFAPGASDVGEGGGTQEIEILVNLFDRPGSELHVSPVGTGGSFVIGNFGINTNATDTEAEPDVDITLTDVPNLRAVGNPGNDYVSAQGGSGTGGPVTEGIELTGGAGADELVGSEGVDFVVGGTGEDATSGMGGSDNMKPGIGNDAIDGGAGSDTVSYSGDAVSGVTVDLAALGVQSTGGGGNDSFESVENLIGTGFPDALRGDDGPNALFGLAGDDSLDVRDGGPDTADCGSETDTVTADLLGIDTLTDCENVLFPATPVPPGPPGPPEPGPSNEFSFGNVKKNKRKGTAKLTAVVPGAGVLHLAATKKVKSDDEVAENEGEETLKVKPKGKSKRKLSETGKAKVEAEVTYTPDGGEPNTQAKRVKLVKR